jgi:hypothetical protein
MLLFVKLYSLFLHICMHRLEHSDALCYTKASLVAEKGFCFLCTVVTGLYALLLQLYMHCWSTVFCVHVVISNFFRGLAFFPRFYVLACYGFAFVHRLILIFCVLFPMHFCFCFNMALCFVFFVYVCFHVNLIPTLVVGCSAGYMGCFCPK